ncbi:MAG: AMP-binding protein, partial [Pseudomonadota bacterium]
MVYGNFATSLLDVASEHPDRPFLIDGHKTWTHGDVASLSAKMAGVLLANGVRPGDRVVVQVEKSPENFALYLAALRAGAVFVPLNTAYTADEVAYFLSDADPTLFVHAPETDGSADIACLTLGTDDKSKSSLLDAAKNAEPSGIVQRRSSDVAAILYTSGTTGRSKGAMLTHANLETNARALVELWGITDADVLLHALPIFHIHGLFVAMHTLMIAGGKILFHRQFDPDQVINDLPNATVMMGVPTFYSRLLDNKRFNAETAKDMRLFVSGSAPLTAEASNAFHEATGQ